MPTYVMNSSSSDSQQHQEGKQTLDNAVEVGVIMLQRAEGSGKHEDAQCQRKDELETYIICAELMFDGTVNSKQTLDNAETEITFPLSNRCRAIDARKSELEAPLRNLILLQQAPHRNPTPVAVPVVVPGCKPRSRWDRSTRWVNF